jgi:hypothetical protein
MGTNAWPAVAELQQAANDDNEMVQHVASRTLEKLSGGFLEEKPSSLEATRTKEQRE